MRSLRFGLVFAASLGLGACEESGNQGGETDSSGSTSSADTGTTNPTTDPSTTGPTDCIAGQETCVCLEGNCLGTLECVHDVCVPGPEIDVPDDPIRVIAGPRVPLDSEILADSFSWAQTGGPEANTVGLDTQTPLVDVPADAAAGDVLRFTLTAVRNEVERTAEVTIEVVEARFEEGLPGIEDVEQLGTPHSIQFRGGELWATMEEGFVSWFDIGYDDELMQEVAVHVGRDDIPGAPYGSRMGQVPERDDDIDVLLLANAGNQALESLQINGGSIETLSDVTIDGEPLGPVRHLLRYDGEIYMTNGESGQLLVWDPIPPEPSNDGSTGAEDPIPAGTRVVLSDLVMPSALAAGPEDGYFFVGVAGQVLRIPVLDSGVIGEPFVYLDFGDTADPENTVDGLVFDRANNLYVGIGGGDRLILARYNGGEAVDITRSMGITATDFSDFQGMRFGDGDFGGGTLYYGNASGRVGRVFVGLGD